MKTKPNKQQDISSRCIACSTRIYQQGHPPSTHTYGEGEQLLLLLLLMRTVVPHWVVCGIWHVWSNRILNNNQNWNRYWPRKTRCLWRKQSTHTHTLKPNTTTSAPWTGSVKHNERRQLPLLSIKKEAICACAPNTTLISLCPSAGLTIWVTLFLILFLKALINHLIKACNCNVGTTTFSRGI